MQDGVPPRHIFVAVEVPAPLSHPRGKAHDVRIVGDHVVHVPVFQQMHHLRVRLVGSDAEKHSLSAFGSHDPVLHQSEEGSVVVCDGLLRGLDLVAHLAPLHHSEVLVLGHVSPCLSRLGEELSCFVELELPSVLVESMLQRVTPAVNNQHHRNVAIIEQKSLEHVLHRQIDLLLGRHRVRALELGVAFQLLGQRQQSAAKVDSNPVALFPRHVCQSFFPG